MKRLYLDSFSDIRFCFVRCLKQSANWFTRNLPIVLDARNHSVQSVSLFGHGLRGVRESKGGEIFRQVAAYLLVPNLLFRISGYCFLTLPRAIFNLDYLAAGLLGLFLPAAAQIFLITVIFLVDVFVSTAPFYYFSQHDLVSSGKYLTLLPWPHIVTTGLALLGMSLGLGLLVVQTAGRVSRRNRRLVAGILLGLLCVLSGLRVISRVRDTAPNLTLFDSTGRKFVVAVWHRRFSTEAATNIVSVPSATGALLDHFRRHNRLISTSLQRRNIVLVLVESYGLMNDAKSAARLEAPYHSAIVLDKYDMQTGTVKFAGPTVSGELRELCGVLADTDFRQVSRISPECLPALLKKQDYRTMAVHGFLSAMFDRKTWYPELGFDDIRFLEDLRNRPGMHICADGAFPGICDTDIVHFLRQDLISNANRRPRFYYWLTLNSHLPIVVVSQNSALLACGSPHAANPDATVCNWMALIYKLNSAIAELGADPELPPTEFIIVGDHAPPFLTNTRRGQFSQGVVPFIHLVPKTRPGAAPSLAFSIHVTP